ncbi:hypothetical protein Tco_1069809 [Tanacetum coccineum]|uniref:Uncharacterized protein n=1 Tax=Tanacetum coccineum TaxID=301880 RepID=A0ABQ5HLJ8_9ASTR
MFQANHEDAYDSDVDEGPNAAVAFMANLSSTSATTSQVNEVHSNDNPIFDNVDYHQNVPTEISADNIEISEKFSICHLNRLANPTRRHAKDLLGYMAKRAQPVLYDADTLLHSAHHHVRIWDSEDVLVHQVELSHQLQGKDTTIRNLDAQINIMKVLNVGSTEDGLKVENVSLKRRYDELSKANTHSRTAYTEKINALTAEIAKLKTELSGKKSGGSTASEKPKVLASGMYTKSSKYIPPPKRANWVKPTPLPKKKQVTLSENLPDLP